MAVCPAVDSYVSFCCNVHSSRLHDSLPKSSRDFFSLKSASVCVQHNWHRKHPENTDRSEKPAVINIVCLINICAMDSCSSVTSHYVVAYKACHKDRMAANLYNGCSDKGEEEILLKLSIWLRMHHQSEKRVFLMCLIFYEQ